MAPPFNKDSPLFRHRQLAPNAAVRVSPLCLGAMTFGSVLNERYGECSKDEAFKIMDHFYHSGGNFIDTANAYRNGESEEWVGEWMATRKNREDIVIATKYSNSYMAGQTDHIQSNAFGTGVRSMKRSLESSLARLQTSWVDLFYVHYWDFMTSIPELMHGLNDLVVAGKVMYLGISDTPAWVVSMANEYARAHGLRTFSVYQGLWSAGIRDLERDIIPMCRQQNMAICPYGVLGQGRFQTEQSYQQRQETGEGRHFIPVSDHDRRISKVLEDKASEKGVELFQVALAYVMQKAPYVFPIVGQRKVAHLEASIAGLSVRMTPEDLNMVDGGYPFDHGFPHTFLSGSLFNRSTSRQVEGPADVWLTKMAGTFDWVKEPEAIPLGQRDESAGTWIETAFKRTS